MHDEDFGPPRPVPPLVTGAGTGGDVVRGAASSAGGSGGRKAFFDPGTGQLVIADLRTSKPDILREASRWVDGERGLPEEDSDVFAAADLTVFAAEALAIGSKVLSIAAQNSDTVAVQQAVRDASEQVTEAVERVSANADETVRRTTEALRRTASDVQQQMMTEVTRLVGGESPELLARLQPILDGVGAKLEKQARDAVAAANAEFAERAERRHTDLVSALADYRTEVSVRLAEETAAREATAALKQGTTIKGFDYEAQMHAICHDIAVALGDEYRETGETAGRLPRNKKGDGVFAVNGDIARVVVEMHDGTSKDWGPYLAEAERNRGAGVSIGLVKHLSDNAGHLIRVIAPKRVVLAFDPEGDDVALLRTVIQLMKTVALTSAGRSGAEEIGTANEAIRESLSLLRDLDEAKRSAAAITGHVEKIEKTISKTVTSVERELNTALNALTGAGLASSSSGRLEDAPDVDPDADPDAELADSEPASIVRLAR